MGHELIVITKTSGIVGDCKSGECGCDDLGLIWDVYVLIHKVAILFAVISSSMPESGESSTNSMMQILQILLILGLVQCYCNHNTSMI